MMRKYSSYLILFCLTHGALASPWMTGALLAPNGITTKPGHFNFEPYSVYTTTPQRTSYTEAPVLYLGITDVIDLETVVPYSFNWANNQRGSAHGFADMTLGFGLQAFTQKENSWIPNLRIAVLEVFPTGKFDQLDPTKKGADQTGIGAYQTIFSFSFQALRELHEQHYLRTHLTLRTSVASDVKLAGITTFGGNPMTHGKVNLGNSSSADLALEYTLTQNWVPVFELFFVTNEAASFTGNPGLDITGAIDTVGHQSGKQLSLAPALEYNFNEHVGIIAGVWFSVSGKPADQFVASTIAINFFY